MGEIDEAIKETLEGGEGGEGGHSGLNSKVAILVAITATFMAFSKIKSENMVQHMEHAQSQSVDTWSYYQAKSTKQVITENMVDQVKMTLLATPNLSKEARAALEANAARFEKASHRYDAEKEEIRKKAEDLEKEHEHYKAIHDELDVAEACYTVAIALAGITALSGMSWLLVMAFGSSALGVLMTLGGFLGWNLHPEWLSKLLG